MYSRANIASLTSPSPTLQRSPDPPKGLAGFGPFMAEDNMIALSLWHELGLKHAMTSDVALDFIGSLTLQGYISRRVRWLRVRKKMTLPATVAEPFTESLVCGLYGSWAIARLIGAYRPAIFLIHMLVWLFVDLRNECQERWTTNGSTYFPGRVGSSRSARSANMDVCYAWR